MNNNNPATSSQYEEHTNMLNLDILCLQICSVYDSGEYGKCDEPNFLTVSMPVTL